MIYKKDPELEKLKDQGRELYEKIEATKKAIRNNQHTDVNSFELLLMEQKFKRIVQVFPHNYECM